MHPDHLFRPARCRSQARDGQGRCVGGQDAALRHHSLNAANHIGLNLGVFKHRFNHQITARQSGIIGRRGNARQNRRLAFLSRGAALDCLIKQSRRMRLAALCRLNRGVHQHHGNSRHGGHMRNSRAHHARADHAQRPHAFIRQGRAARAFV